MQFFPQVKSDFDFFGGQKAAGGYILSAGGIVMQQKTTLAALRKGERAVVRKVPLRGDGSDRLRAVGFSPGETVECRASGIYGSPAAYRLRGRLVALNQADSRKIIVKK